MDSPTRTAPLHDRYAWLDQARGVIVLMLIISMVTDKYSGDILLGDPPVGPPAYNHGYAYFIATPVMITFIDLGQSLFMFMMGFVGYGAFTSRLQKRGGRAAFFYAFRRVGVLYAIAFLESVLGPYLASEEPNWTDFFFNSTFTMLALGSLAAIVSIVLCPDADRRMGLSVVVTMAHALLYVYPVFHHHSGTDNIPNLHWFPFGIMGTCAVAIAGTAFGQWYSRDPKEPNIGFRERIAPVAMGVLTAAYCVDWLQPAQHHDATAALQLQSIALGGFTLMIFYAFSVVGFTLPVLVSMGKNLLLLFVVGGILVQIYLAFMPKSLLMRWPELALLLAGFIPVVFVAWLAVLLDKRGIMVRA